MGKEFSLEPVDVPEVKTRHRRVRGKLPHPDSIETLEKLRTFEPISMRGQPPIVWERAEGFNVYDAYGNSWIDFSSGVLVTNAGHGMPAVRKAIVDQAKSGLLHNYCFPAEERAALAERIVGLAPDGLDKVFLLTTGSEATENAIKLARSWGRSRGGDKKIGIVGFERGFHGRTLGAQQAGGMPGQKEWIVNEDPAIVQVPFPDGYWNEDVSFDGFLAALKKTRMRPDHVAGVMLETYQGVGPDFAPTEYVQRLAEWCKEHDALLIFDEVQAGFGRCGTMWGFEHYGVTPDLFCFGKGASSSLPVSGVVGRQDILDQFPPGSMTSTHTGNPICAAAALAAIDLIVEEGMVENARELEPVMMKALRDIAARHPEVVGNVTGKGLVGGLQLVMPGEKLPNPDLAHDVVERCYRMGLLFFAPVGAWGQTVKVSPPLMISREAFDEGLAVLVDAVNAAVRGI